MIKLKRVYEGRSQKDGFRILVDRLWPRGVSRKSAGVKLWLKEIAPSDGLRKWFSHEPEKWKTFLLKYRRELQKKKSLLQQIRNAERENGTVTLVFGARDEEQNNAVALARILRKRRRPTPR